MLSSVDLSAVTIRVLTIEDNYGDPAIARAMAACGYALVATLGQDLVFARDDVRSPALIA